MAPPKGNQFWKQRSSHGRRPIFASPDDLWNAACEYFEWVDANPLYEDKVTSYQGVNSHEPLMKMRAMTLGAMCLFIDINHSTWCEYCKKDGFSEVTARIDAIIRAQKFEGAAAELLNANIIARDLGLADKQETTAEIDVNNKMDDMQLARAIAFALNRADRKANKDNET